MHYSAGPGTSLEFDKIYVAPVKNDSFAPQAQALLTKQIRTKLANCPGLELASSSENAAILEVTIIDFGQSMATTRDDDTIRAKSFDVKMSVSCTLSDDATGKVYFKNYHMSDSVECHAFDDNFQASQYQAIPQLTNKLADKICDAVCNPW
jgi:hypothetical protein